MFESSNALVYSLDRAMQEVRFYKEHLFSYEQELEAAMNNAYREKLIKMKAALTEKDRVLAWRHEELMQIVNAHISEEEKRLQAECKSYARRIGNQS